VSQATDDETLQSPVPHSLADADSGDAEADGIKYHLDWVAKEQASQDGRKDQTIQLLAQLPVDEAV
jgi:hypothetical protein